VALDNKDRGRFFFALLITLIALPSMWWFSQSDTTAETSQDGDVAVTTDPTPSTPEPPPTTIGQTNLPPPDAVGSVPIFLDGPEGQIGGVPEIAVPGQPTTESIIADATFRRSMAGQQTCLSRTILSGGIVTVVNLDNNRTTTCRVSLAPAGQREDLVMDLDRFTEIADVTDAPIPVEIRL
jgi:hypothetical protein